MGSTGSFLESGGFSAPAQWHTIDYIDGIKVIDPKDPKKRPNLPARSNTPGTTYISLNKDEGRTFNQLRVYDEKRMPVLTLTMVFMAKTNTCMSIISLMGKDNLSP